MPWILILKQYKVAALIFVRQSSISSISQVVSQYLGYAGGEIAEMLLKTRSAI